jgi:hypothetical protein
MLNNRKPWLFTLRNVIRTRSERLVLWLRGQPRQHFGPKARIPELFQRRDLLWLALQSGKLRMQEPRPTVFHDLLDAAARVRIQVPQPHDLHRSAQEYQLPVVLERRDSPCRQKQLACLVGRPCTRPRRL